MPHFIAMPRAIARPLRRRKADGEIIIARLPTVAENAYKRPSHVRRPASRTGARHSNLHNITMHTPSLTRLLTLTATLALAGLCPTPGRAGLVYSEGFDYGAAAISLEGRNGGTGFAGGWQNLGVGSPGVYAPAGLTFSDLSVSGGKVFNPFATIVDPPANIANFDRPLASALSGVFYGSFLSQIEPGGTRSLAGIGLGVDNTVNPGVADQYRMFAPDNGFALAAGAGVGAPSASGSALLAGQTYLTLFKLDTGARSITAWLMGAAQYDAFKVGGFTEAELNGATVGTGDANLWARANFTNSTAISAPGFLSMKMGDGSSTRVSLDEFRLSNTSLNEAAPAATPVVPEPGTALFGLALLAPALTRRARR